MKLTKRMYLVLSLLLVAALAGSGAVVASGPGSQVSASRIDGGAELLDQASITLEQAIAAAQAAEDGALDEIDLEFYQGVLVFNVDVGNKDVKVDAADGAVLGYEIDDVGDKDDGPEND